MRQYRALSKFRNIALVLHKNCNGNATTDQSPFAMDTEQIRPIHMAGH